MYFPSYGVPAPHTVPLLGNGELQTQPFAALMTAAAPVAGATVIVQEKELGKRLQHIKGQLLLMALLVFVRLLLHGTGEQLLSDFAWRSPFMLSTLAAYICVARWCCAFLPLCACGLDCGRVVVEGQR